MMQNTRMALAISELPSFQHYAPQFGINVVSVMPGDEENCIIDFLSEEAFCLYALGSLIGYEMAYKEAQPVMDKALSQMNETVEKFNELKKLLDDIDKAEKQLSQLKEKNP